MNALALLVMTACPVGAGPVVLVQYPVGGPATYPADSYSAGPSWNGDSGCCPAPCGGDCCGTSGGEVVSCCPEPCCQSRPGLFSRIRAKVRSWRHGRSCDCCSDCCASCDGCGSYCASCDSYGATSAGGLVTPGAAMPFPATGAPFPVPTASEYPIQPMPLGEPVPEAIPTAPHRVK